MTLRLRKDRILKIGPDGHFRFSPFGRVLAESPDGFQVGEEGANPNPHWPSPLIEACRLFKNGNALQLQDIETMWTRSLLDLQTRALRRPMVEIDFLGGSYAAPPWLGSALAGGTVVSVATFSNSNHPGWVRLSSAAALDSGYGYRLGAATWIVTLAEVASAIFQTYNNPASAARFGFFATATAQDSDGYFIKIENDKLFGRCKNGAVVTDTATQYTLSNPVYYRCEVFFTLTSAEFRLYAKNPFTAPFSLVWSDSVTDPASWPTAIMNAGWISVNTDNPGTAKYLHAVDWMEIRQEYPLDR